MPQLSFGARVRKSPFFDRTVAAGAASFTVYNHMYLPTGYGDPLGEYWRLIEGVSMWDVACERQVEIAGPDAERLVRYLTPRDLGSIESGQGRYVPMCNASGALINDPVLLPLEDRRFWFSIADSDVLLWAQGIALAGGYDVTIREPDVSPLAIQGPKAMDVAEALFGGWVRELKYFAFRETQFEGSPLFVARSGWSKQGGVELYLRDGSMGGKLWDLVAEAGKPFGIAPGTPNGIERVESGLISVGADTDEWANPFEMGLGKYVALDREDDFAGKAALAEVANQGVRRRFVGFRIGGERLVSGSQHCWKLLHKNQCEGFISAACFSPRVKSGAGGNIGVGLINAELADDGHRLFTQSEAGTRDVTVTALPFNLSGR
jgi:glycine cleavage system aminomethyltransferase T